MHRSIISLVMLRWEGSSAFTSGITRSSTLSLSVGGGISEEKVIVRIVNLKNDQLIIFVTNYTVFSSAISRSTACQSNRTLS